MCLHEKWFKAKDFCLWIVNIIMDVTGQVEYMFLSEPCLDKSKSFDLRTIATLTRTGIVYIDT